MKKRTNRNADKLAAQARLELAADAMLASQPVPFGSHNWPASRPMPSDPVAYGIEWTRRQQALREALADAPYVFGEFHPEYNSR
jgi:hypothetical protein